MRDFSIQQLAHFSGIKPHTLRAWEARYHAFMPVRHEHDQRSYSIDELEKAIWLALLSKNGYRISKIAVRSIEELKQHIQKLKERDDLQLVMMHRLIIHMFRHQTEAFESLLDDCFATYGVPDGLMHTLIPFLERTNLLFQGRQRLEEHYVVPIIRKKLMALDKEIFLKADANIEVLLFLFETKQLDLGLLVINNLLKGSGIQVLYLGNDISIANLKTVFLTKKPDFIYTYLPKKNLSNLKEISSLLKNMLPETKLYFSTNPCTGQNMTIQERMHQLPFLDAWHAIQADHLKVQIK